MSSEIEISFPTEQRYAGFWIRVAAYFIDVLILFGIGFVLGLVLAIAGMESPIASGLIGALTGLAYYFTLPTLLGGTLGKRILKLRIVDLETGGNISYLKSIGRYFCYIVSSIPLCAGYIWIGFDERKQGWHDKIVKTVVVHD